MCGVVEYLQMWMSEKEILRLILRMVWKGSKNTVASPQIKVPKILLINLIYGLQGEKRVGVYSRRRHIMIIMGRYRRNM